MNLVTQKITIVAACFLFNCTQAQVNSKNIHLSIVPGLSTSGLEPGNISSHLSLNLFTGYLHSLYGIEISGISSLNSQHTQGIQVSGLFNMTGPNQFAMKDRNEVRQMQRNGESADMIGAQIAGLINFVRGSAVGGQVTLGVNLTKSMLGVQIAGIANSSNKYLLGGQLSLLANVSNGPTEGFQIGIGLNKTKDDLEGGQLGMINLAGLIEGINSIDSDKPTAIQFGVFNKAKKMNGFQVGLINISGEMRGTQIGLINIYNTPVKPGKKGGTAIGLINTGNLFHLYTFVDETFLFNAALGTGNDKNYGIIGRPSTKFLMNYLLYRQNQFTNVSMRAYGYGFEKYYFNVEMGPNNEFRFLSWGLSVSYVDMKEKTYGANGLLELTFSGGTRISNKMKSLYLKASIDGNFHYGSNYLTMGPEKLSVKKQSDTSVKEFWPGFRLGVLMH